jgi:hypothetical protein
MKEAFSRFAPQMKHSKEQQEIANIPSQIGCKGRYVRIGAHNKLVCGPIILTQEICEKKDNQTPVPVLRGLNILKDAVQQPHDVTKQRYDILKILS